MLATPYFLMKFAELTKGQYTFTHGHENSFTTFNIVLTKNSTRAFFIYHYAVCNFINIIIIYVFYARKLFDDRF